MSLRESLQQEQPQQTASKYQQLPVDKVDPNPQQPRRVFNDTDLKDLVDSVSEYGVLQPIVVRSSSADGRWELIAGERRLRAARKLGLETIPAIIEKVLDKDLLALALVENIQRADLNPIEEAEAIQSLINDHDLSHEECGVKLGKDRSTIVNALRLLALPFVVKEDIESNRLSAAHGKALLQLGDEQLILQVHKTVVAKDLSVKQTRKLCQSFERKGGSKSPQKTDHDMEYIAETLRAMLQTKVKVAGTSSKGRIEVSYFSASELERILEILKPENALF